MKRILAFLLAMVMVLALAACAKTPAADTNTPAEDNNVQEPADNTGDTNEPADTDEPAEPAEPADDTTTEDDGWGGLQFPLSTEGDTFRFFRDTTTALTYFYDSLDEVPQFIEAEKRTGVHIDWEVVSDFDTQFPLMIASGDWADCAASWTKGGDLATYAEDEIVLELSDLIEEYCPNYNKRRTEDAAIARDTSTDEGLVLAFYNIKQSIQGSWMGPWARADWVDAWGGGDIKTYADWEDYLSWAVANHTDMTIPYIFNANGLDRYLLSGYDLSDSWYVENGEVKYSPLQPAMKDYVQMCHGWYEKGLINDYAFSGERLFFDDYAQGGCAMATSFQNWWDTVYGYAEDPNFGMLAITPPMLDADHHRRIETGTSPMTRNESLSAYLFTSCDKPEILCQWFDQWFSDKGCIIADYGIEGESFYFNEDGKPTFTDDILHNNEGYGYSTAWMKYIDTNIPRYYDWTREQNDAMPASGLEAQVIWDEGWVDELTYPQFATRNGKEGERYSSIMSDVETTLNENVPKFIRGDRPMSEWDSFVAQLSGMNIEEARDIQQAAYERYMARPVD